MQADSTLALMSAFWSSVHRLSLIHILQIDLTGGEYLGWASEGKDEGTFDAVSYTHLVLMSQRMAAGT